MSNKNMIEMVRESEDVLQEMRSGENIGVLGYWEHLPVEESTKAFIDEVIDYHRKTSAMMEMIFRNQQLCDARLTKLVKKL